MRAERQRELIRARGRLVDVSGAPAEARRSVLAAIRGVVAADAGLESRAVLTSSGGWVASADPTIEGEG